MVFRAVRSLTPKASASTSLAVCDSLQVGPGGMISHISGVGWTRRPSGASPPVSAPLRQFIQVLETLKHGWVCESRILPQKRES